MPLTTPCKPRQTNWQGGIGVTLIDSLDALLIMSRRKELGAALQSLQEQVTFNKNEKVRGCAVWASRLGPCWGCAGLLCS